MPVVPVCRKQKPPAVEDPISIHLEAKNNHKHVLLNVQPRCLTSQPHTPSNYLRFPRGEGNFNSPLLKTENKILQEKRIRVQNVIVAKSYPIALACDQFAWEDLF